MFFVVSPVELTDDLEIEIQESWPFLLDETGLPNTEKLEINKLQGGVEINCHPVLALQLNRVLKLASRILWRKELIKAREIYQLESQLKSLNWSKWCTENDRIKFSISASESKINNEKKIHEILEKLLSKKYKIVKDNETLHFYVRHYQNEFQLSLDTSGEHLHKRGLTLHKTKAPLRETLAAAGIRWMLNDKSVNEFSKITWLDPMAGSGTHVAELLSVDALSPRTEFSFLTFKEAPKILKSDSFWSHHPLARAQSFKKIVAADKSTDSIEVLHKNFKNQNLRNIRVFNLDLFSATNRSFYEIDENERLFIIANPPYGERLSLDEPRVEIEKMFNHLCKHLKPERIGIWLPLSMGEIKTEAHLISKKRLKNGGIPVAFHVYEIES